MFEFKYNSEGSFIPMAMTIHNELATKASAEDMENTKKDVEELTGTVEKQDQNISKNASDISTNAAAISDNTDAITEEVAAREEAVDELNEKISEIPRFRTEIVDELPETGETDVIYLVKSGEVSGGNEYDEYIYTGEGFEKLGPMVDLSGYVTKDELDAAVNDINDALDLKADADSVYTKDEADAKFLTEHQDISNLATKTELANGLAEKANADDVYTKDEADAKFLTEHQDISNLATKAELADEVSARESGDENAMSEIEALAGSLSEEVANRESADETLDTNINNVASALESEVSAREAGDENAMNSISSVTAALESEAAARESGDQTAMSAVDGLSANTVAEINRLEGEINEIPKVRMVIVEELPESGTPATFYFVPASEEAENLYNEYVYINNAWEEIGPKSIDLSDYALKSDVEILDTRCDNIDAEIVGLATSIAQQGDAIATKADADDVYTKAEADAKFLTEHQDISNLATKDELAEGLAEKADADDVYTKDEADAKFLTEHQDISNLATKTELANGLAEKANADDVYTKDEADAKFLTEHQDISNLATKAEVEAVDDKVDAIVIPDLTPYAKSEDVTAEIAAASAVLAAKDDAQDAEIALKANAADVYTKAEVDALIATKEAEIYNLTKIVGDLGGAVVYELPGENGKSFNTLMGNNGTVKLTDDVTTGRFGPGITAKNTVTLNLSTHNLTVTGLTETSAQGAIMSRGTQHITIGGKGTIDAGAGICIEANGADSVINLTGSTSIYHNDRSGGELVYCYAGTVNITNGTFKNDGTDKKYLLNCYDANYRSGTAKIIVTGGKFYDFDPANNTAEGEGTSFVPEGYESIHTTEEIEGVIHDVYTVKKVS